MVPSQLRDAMQIGVYPITQRLTIGKHATQQRATHLKSLGVTHILNVGEGVSVISERSNGFQKIVDLPIADLCRIPNERGIECLDILHGLLLEAESRVYVHCIACQNRSPTIVWLYFIACGMSAVVAAELIASHCPDAVPGHKTLVDQQLIDLVKEHGLKHFLPLVDHRILEPINL